MVVGETVMLLPVPNTVPVQLSANHSMVPVVTEEVKVMLVPEQMMAPPKVASLRSVVIAAGCTGAVVKLISLP